MSTNEDSTKKDTASKPAADQQSAASDAGQLSEGELDNVTGGAARRPIFKSKQTGTEDKPKDDPRQFIV